MKYLFPFSLVPKNSRIILYGAGNVGKDFYLQLRMIAKSECYCEIVAWVDRAFSIYQMKPPFDYVENILNHSFDYVVIAVRNPQTAQDIKNDLKEQGVPESKIVWSRSLYDIGFTQFPTNRFSYLSHLDFYMDLLDEYNAAETEFGGAGFYQGFPELGIPGTRNSGERVSLCHINDFLGKEDTALDIGCNCGFFSLQASSYVKHIDAYDISPHFINIANKAKLFLGIKNVDFYCENFFDTDKVVCYDAIFAFAVYGGLLASGFGEEELTERLYRLLNVGGYLFFESHNIKQDAERYYRLCAFFDKIPMKVCLRQEYISDAERHIVVYKKLS